jgi:hypothetical protein
MDAAASPPWHFARTATDLTERSTHMRKFIISTIALASLASVAFLYSAGPADAKKMTCQQKAAACESRCARRGGDWVACIYRTCVHQYGTCGN